MKALDLTGKRFGKLVAIERAEPHIRENGRKVSQWKCKCDCGNICTVFQENLVHGNTTSCGCTKKERKNLLGQRFGKLVVIERAEDRFDKRGKVISRWKCQCDCGNTTIVDQSSLVTGNTTSCGCINRKHGMSKTRLYTIYMGMIQRCYDTNAYNFENYGGRGITICPEWLGENGFMTFHDWAMGAGYDETLSIDRIDNDGPYAPWNCHWVTRTIQSNNRRSNSFITYNGETHTYADWEKILGYPESTISNRVNRFGMTDQQALFGTENTTLPINAIYFVDDDGNFSSGAK